MKRLLKLAFIVFISVLIVPNAVLVLFKKSVHQEYDTTPKPPDLAISTTSKTECRCSSSHHFAEAAEVTAAPRPTVDYKNIASETPSRTKKTKYSRLGSELDLDYAAHCPRRSLMVNLPNSNFTPNHLDCPTLFIIGARKAGTSSLYMYVSRHPRFKGILLDQGPKVGETFYFSSHWDSQDWSTYMECFQHTSRYMTGESSVGNLVHCDVPDRLWKSCGKQAKVVILLRDPIKRLESNLKMRMRLGSRGYSNATKPSTVVNVELEEFLSAGLQQGVEMSNIENAWGKFLCLFPPSKNLVFEGFYYVHIMNWLCNFPPENILILNSEEFYSDTQKVFEEVIEFLNLSTLDSNTTAFITSAVYNEGWTEEEGGHRGWLGEMEIKKLKAVYKHSNKQLFKMLKWKNINWY